MNKLIISFLALLSTSVFSQVKFGLKFSPNLSITGVRSDSVWDKNKVGTRFVGGMFADFSLTDNVAFHLGLEYAPKKVSLKYNDITSSYNLQYIQVPIGLKFYTNEFADRFKLYFLLDPNLAFKISEKSNKDNDKFTTGNYQVDLVKYADSQGKNAFQFFDIGINVGIGTEVRVGEATYLFGGFSYNRGLINAMNPLLKDPNNTKFSDIARVTTNLINLDLGIKF